MNVKKKFNGIWLSEACENPRMLEERARKRDLAITYFRVRAHPFNAHNQIANATTDDKHTDSQNNGMQVGAASSL